MTRSNRISLRGAFTLIELLIVVLIIAILIGLLLPAVQKVRESSQVTRCKNNLHQLGVAIQTFHTANGSYPSYNGIYPANSGSVDISANSKAVYGSWFVHLMPFVDQEALYQTIVADINTYGTNGPATVTVARSANYQAANPTGPLLQNAYTTPATDYQWQAQAGTSTQYHAGSTTTTTVPAGLVSGIDYSFGTFNTTTQTYQGWTEYFPHGTHYWDAGSNVYHPAVYGPPTPQIGDPGHSNFVGVWNPTVTNAQFKVLQCSSDPSFGTSTTTGQGGSGVPYSQSGLVYVNDPNSTTAGSGAAISGQTAYQSWGSTNYVANWNAITNGEAVNGYKAAPGTISRIANRDGTSNTIMFSETYAWCNGKGRTAVMAWHNQATNSVDLGTHNFGLTEGGIQAGGGDQSAPMFGWPTPGGSQPANPAGQNVGVPYPVYFSRMPNGFVVIPPNAPASSTDTRVYDFKFQIRPVLTNATISPTTGNPAGGCAQGVMNCCNRMKVQSGHSFLNVAMADGSVRSLMPSISLLTWDNAMLVDDGQVLGAPLGDW